MKTDTSLAKNLESLSVGLQQAQSHSLALLSWQEGSIEEEIAGARPSVETKHP